jgi:hypothetical protein
MLRLARQLMIAPRDSPDITETMLANDPMLSTDPADPMLPMLRTEPTEPIDSSEFAEPMQSIELRER